MTELIEFDTTTHQLNSVPDGFAAQGTVPIRLDWTPLQIGDRIAAGTLLGHWIWQTGRTPILAPEHCSGTVRDLRQPDCDILDQPPSQCLLVLGR